MGRPKSIWMPSPNFSPRNPGREIGVIVLHATVGGKEASLAWLCNKDSKVSAHYLIDELGAIYNLVAEQNVAWHSGESAYKGMPSVNSFSIGIELVNPNDGTTTYTEAQLQACADLVSDICMELNISSDDVVGHKDIAPGRKTDPAGFPWESFKSRMLGMVLEKSSRS